VSKDYRYHATYAFIGSFGDYLGRHCVCTKEGLSRRTADELIKSVLMAYKGFEKGIPAALL